MLNLSLQRELDRIDAVMYDSPGNYFIKDLRGCYLYFNNNSLNIIGRNHSFLGKTDTALPWAEYYHLYREADQRVVQVNQTLNFTEPLINQKKQMSFASVQKKPFYHQGQVIGVAGVSIEVSQTEFNNNRLLVNTQTYIDNRNKRKLNLSKRQSEVLYWILQGLSAREAAKKLHVSSRTVEHHVTNIRETNDFSSLKDMLLHVRAL
jgi:DNA-binding CsgD family transcriptional regulator